MNNPVDGVQRLCYVSSLGHALEAYFTDADIAYQWGDDWNDAPFEHNAGEPYPDWTDADGVRHKANITRLIIQGSWRLISEGLFNSPYSVEQINAGLVAWLLPDPVDFEPYCRVPVPDSIWAGTSQSEFIARIQATGGLVYELLTDISNLSIPTIVQAWRFATAAPMEG